MQLKSEKGLALIQILISIGIVSILSLAIASVVEGLSKENRALAEKMASIDLTRVLSSALANTSTCSSIFASTTLPPSAMPFNITHVSEADPYIIPIQTIPNVVTAGTAASPLSNSLVILPNEESRVGIRLSITNMNPPTARLEVNFDQGRLLRPIRNLNFPGILLATQGSPEKTVVTGCRNPGSGVGGGFQSFQPRAVNTSYAAATDGLILTTVMASSSSRSTYISVMVGGNIVGNSGTTDSSVEESMGPQSLTIPVPKDSSWRVDVTGGQTSNVSVTWIPIGAP